MLNFAGKLAAVPLLAMMLGTAAQAQEPRDGGVINFVAPYGSSFSSLDIHASPQTQDEFWAKAIHRSLYAWDAVGNKPVLELASGVEVSDDKLVYTFSLLPNAVFHDGSTLTADDVIYSYKRILDPQKAFAGARYLSDIAGAAEFASGQSTDISGLKKIDDATVEITFTAPIEPGFQLMRASTAIYPEGAGENPDFLTNPVGLGPFKLAEYVPGSRLTAVKNEDFYEAGKPHVDKINIMIMGDSAARDVAFRNHEIDVTVLGSAQYVAYQADPALAANLLEVAEVYTRHVGFNFDHEVFKDKRVRQAINHAINSDLIIERLVKNKAYRATGWLPTTSPAFDGSMAPYAYDPEKARALLAEAGVADGLAFEIIATGNESWGMPIVEALIPMLAEVGITVTAKPVESSVLPEMLAAGDFQAYIWSQSSGPDAQTALQCFYSKISRAACNYRSYANADFDALYEQAQNAGSDAEKNDLLRKANNLLQEEAPSWFFNYNKAVMAHQPWLHGLQPNSMELAVQSYEDLWLDETAPADR